MNRTKRTLSRVVGLALVMSGGALVAAGEASANDRAVVVSCTDQTAGTWKVSVTFSSIEVRADRPVDVSLGNQTVTLTEPGPNGTVTLEQSFTADQTHLDLVWSVVRQDYQNMGKLHLTQPAGCRETTTPPTTPPPSTEAPPTTQPPPSTEAPPVTTPEAKSLQLDAAPVCQNDTPYVTYQVTPVGFTPQSNVTIRWKTAGGRVAQELTDQPFSGLLLWPGAVVSGGQPVDWPGWDQAADGTWFEVPTDLRPTMTVEFTVNPTGAVQVAYPPATPTCHPSPTNAPQVEAARVQALPVTGGPTWPLVILGACLVLGGLLLVRTGRRRPGQVLGAR